MSKLSIFKPTLKAQTLFFKLASFLVVKTFICSLSLKTTADHMKLSELARLLRKLHMILVLKLFPCIDYIM